METARPHRPEFVDIAHTAHDERRLEGRRKRGDEAAVRTGAVEDIRGHALGDCALDCNLLGTAEYLVGPMEEVLPVDLRVSGCPPTPERSPKPCSG